MLRSLDGMGRRRTGTPCAEMRSVVIVFGVFSYVGGASVEGEEVIK